MKLLCTTTIVLLLLSCKSHLPGTDEIDIDKNHNFRVSQTNDVFSSDYNLIVDKWYAENSYKKAKNEIIVAVLDSQIDLSHEDLRLIERLLYQFRDIFRR